MFIPNKKKELNDVPCMRIRCFANRRHSLTLTAFAYVVVVVVYYNIL